MGHPIPPPSYGNDCLACFAPGMTPDKVVIFISGVEKCHLLTPMAPLGGAYVLTQVDDCLWKYADGIQTVEVERNITNDRTLFLQSNPGQSNFGCVIMNPCASGGPNQNVCTPIFFPAQFGSCHVDFSPWPATPRKLCDDYGLLPSEDTMTDPYMIQDEPPTTVVYTLANIKYSTKLRVKYDYTV